MDLLCELSIIYLLYSSGINSLGPGQSLVGAPRQMVCLQRLYVRLFWWLTFDELEASAFLHLLMVDSSILRHHREKNKSNIR